MPDLSAADVPAAVNAAARALVNAEPHEAVGSAWKVAATIALNAALPALRAALWPCDNYAAPRTCLTAPSSEPGRCDFCSEQASATVEWADAEQDIEWGFRHRETGDQVIRVPGKASPAGMVGDSPGVTAIVRRTVGPWVEVTE
ncbi:hypothetical protein DT076_16725 [Desertihabitans brevis]|uniref:Uncharacterized protein n=1 Tax=Desertihabitans brevis TaxID=2268447 RepID=A0A367YTI8_9ACTN|nr:hypothetical protein [Desertihabitans brevis]RCK68291.1 hypothetical protein DT076_16725 [Desertihabitans brevis]